MTSPTPSHPYERPSIGEFSFRLTPTPADSYRCPVSTPSNYVQRHSRIRRTKPMVDVIYSQPTTANGRQQRSKGMALTRHSRNARATPKVPLQVGNSLKYYFVDQNSDQKEEEHTNTHWLKALCSQPVEEILNKYRRKSDVKRTRIIWCKTFTTPGERSLLSAWENNVFQSKNRTRDVKSEYFRGYRTEESPRRKMRQTQSEPPLSRAHNAELLLSGTISPVSGRKELRTPIDVEHGRGDISEFLTEPSPRKPFSEFLGEDPSNRVSSYVTQYFAPKGKGPIYAKVIKSPETLPKMSSHHRISSMSKTRYNVPIPEGAPIALIPEVDTSAQQS